MSGDPVRFASREALALRDLVLLGCAIALAQFLQHRCEALVGAGAGLVCRTGSLVSQQRCLSCLGCMVGAMLGGLVQPVWRPCAACAERGCARASRPCSLVRGGSSPGGLIGGPGGRERPTRRMPTAPSP